MLRSSTSGSEFLRLCVALRLFIPVSTLKPFRTLAETKTPDGSRLTLHEHDGQHYLKLNGRQLMSTDSITSELQLADLACTGLHGRADVRVLIGGLGLGFSLQRALALVGRHAKVQVAELLAEVVRWNREFLQRVNGALLDEPRVEVIVGDVFNVIRKARSEWYDAILLDVDNGPTSLVQKRNAAIYDKRGFGLIKRALKIGGKVAFWSACPEPMFANSLKRAGFAVEAVPARAHERAKRAAHMIYVGERTLTPEAPPAPAPQTARAPRD
jgi:spermidine synthase